MWKGERPIGAAKGKQTNTMASCHPPPPPLPNPCEKTPLSEQCEVLFPQLVEPWNLAVPFSGCL